MRGFFSVAAIKTVMSGLTLPQPSLSIPRLCVCEGFCNLAGIWCLTEGTTIGKHWWT